MRLVDHHHVVLRDHRDALDRVDREQGVVGDDQLGAAGPLLGALGEALGAVGASARPEALTVADADLSPDPVGMTGRVVALAGAALLRLLLDPVAQAQNLSAHGSLGEVDEGALVVGDSLAHAVQAGVVGATLEHGVRRPLTELLARGVEQGRDVALHQLVLQGECRRGHDNAVVVQQRRDEVAERLAGAGARLDEQVSPALHGLGDGLRHRHLARALLPTELAHRGVEDRTDCRLLDHPSTLCRAPDHDGGSTQRVQWFPGVAHRVGGQHVHTGRTFQR